MTYFLNTKDIKSIVSEAKRNMLNYSLPLFIDNKQVEQCDVPSLAILESVITSLNSKGLLNTLVKVGYTELVADYDPEFSLEDK